MFIYIPYTYLIGWSKYQKYYYGVRYKSGCNPKDLWTKYFTSSKKVKELRSLYGDPDIIQIRKTFNTESEARFWESKVLRRMKVVIREDFLNQTDNIAISLEATAVAKPGTSKAMLGNTNASGNKGKAKSIEHRLAIAAAMKGKPKSEEHKRKQSQIMKGRKQSLESNLKRSLTLKKAMLGNTNASGNKGKAKSIEHRLAISVNSSLLYNHIPKLLRDIY